MADSTIILQDFDATKIMGGAYGHLQQEFRGLEILDYISSKLKYDGDLPDSINGHCRNVLLHQFQEQKGLDYNPQQIHPAIQWNNSDHFIVQESDDVKWHIPKSDKIYIYII